MTDWINYEAVNRTAPATPGLLKSGAFMKSNLGQKIFLYFFPLSGQNFEVS